MSLFYTRLKIIRPVLTETINNHISIIIILLLLFLMPPAGLSQTKVIDSLKTAALNSSDSNKAKILLSIANKYRLINYDSVIFYANKAYDRALLTHNYSVATESLIELAYTHISIGDNEKSLLLYNQAKQLSIEENNQHLLAKIYLDLGRFYSTLSNYAGVLSSLDTALHIINSNHISNLKPLVYNQIGQLYLLIHDLSIASYYSKLAISCSKNDSNKSNYISNLFLRGSIFLQNNELDSALYYYSNGLTIAKETNNKKLIQQAYRKIADYYIIKEEYDKSYIYIDSSIVYCKELNFTNDLASLITYKAHILSKNGDYENALKHNLQALELRKATGHKASICASLLNIGSNYTHLEEYAKANIYLEKGIKIAENQNLIPYLNYGYDKLSILNKLKGNYENALKYAELKIQYKDSIITNSTNEKVMFFKSQYELEKEKTLSEKLKLKKKSNEVIFLIVITILSIGLIILLSILNYLRKKSTKEIVKLSRIIEATTQAVAIINDIGKVVYVNNALLLMMGYANKNEILGEAMYEFTNNEGKRIINNEIVPALLTKGFWNGEITNKRKDGTLFIAEETCSTVNNKKEIPEYYVTIFNDITDRKKTESKLKTSQDNLEKTVKTKDKIFSIIAHDLTAPFSSILGLSELMANDFDVYKKEDIIQFSQLIYKSSKNTLDLLTNLLDWSRSQLGSIKLAKENLNIHDLISENAKPLLSMINKKEISFNNEVSRDFNVYIDYNTISTVVRNLMSNAIKFTPRGGTIIVTAIKTDAIIYIKVTDTGIGIMAENISGLFETNDSKSIKGTEDEKGTGLGLILCKEFAELNNGTITVESTFGKGSTFTLSIPSA